MLLAIQYNIIMDRIDARLQVFAKKWHVVDPEKGKYFLVEVLGESADKHRVQIRYHEDRYYVAASELLPYEPNKPAKLNQLRFYSRPEVIDCLSHLITQGKFIQLSNRVILDLCEKEVDFVGREIRTSHEEYERMCEFMVKRFLVSNRKRQYVCIHSPDLGKGKSRRGYLFGLLNTFTKSKALWPYAFSLNTLSLLLYSFLQQFSFTTKFSMSPNSEIVRIMLSPFRLVTQRDQGASTFHDSSEPPLFKLRANIFLVMLNGSKQFRKFYRIPNCYDQPPPSQISSDNLLDAMTALSFKAGEINLILQMFSLVLNLNAIEFERNVKRQEEGDVAYKIREKGGVRGNLVYLLDELLVKKLENELNRQLGEEETTMKNIRGKLAVIVRLVWEEAVFKVCHELNEKLINLRSQFKETKQLIFIEFPRIPYCEEQTTDNYILNYFNQLILSAAIGGVQLQKHHHFDQSSIHQELSLSYESDINNYILKEEERQIKLHQELRRCDFITHLRQAKMKITTTPINYQNKLLNMKEIISSLKKPSSDSYCQFVIKSQIKKGLIINKSLMDSLIEGMTERRQDPQDYKQVSGKDEIMEMELDKFCLRYYLSSGVKNIWAGEKHMLKDYLLQYIYQRQQKGQPCQFSCVKHEQSYTVLIRLPMLIEMEEQVKEHDKVASQIQEGLSNDKQRPPLINSSQLVYDRIRFFHLFKLKIMPLLKECFLKIKHRAPIQNITRLWSRLEYNHCRLSFHAIRKHGSINKIVQTLNQSKPPFLDLKAFDHRVYRKNKAVHDIKNWMEAGLLNKQLAAFDKIHHNYDIQVISPSNKKEDNELTGYMQELKKEWPKNVDHTSEKKKQQLFLSPPPPSKRTSPDSAQNNSPSNSQASNDSSNIINKSKPNIIIITEQPQQGQNSNRMPLEDNNKQPNLTRNVSISPGLKAAEDKNQKDMENRNASNYSNYKQLVSPRQQNDMISSCPPSSYRGIQKSQIPKYITKAQLCLMMDLPTFSFEIWMKEAVGFQKRKPKEPLQNPIIKPLFAKYQLNRVPIGEPEDELNVDILIKQKVLINPFLPYLMDLLQFENEQKMQKYISHQSSLIDKPILQEFPLEKYPKMSIDNFNILLKIGMDKNTTKDLLEMINAIVRPIRQSYTSEKKNVSTVFEGEPAIITDHSWHHNIIKDEIFLQFIKQLMMNVNELSMQALAHALEIVTRYHYPSPQFMYPFLHYLKSLQSKNIQKLNESFINTLLFAQAYEGYKGSHVTVLKEGVSLKEKECSNRLEPRLTEITKNELDKCVKIVIRMFNEFKYEFKVRNQILSHFRRRLLGCINLLHYEDYIGLYYCPKRGASLLLTDEKVKAIDFLVQFPQNEQENLLYIKLKWYFPFNLNEINKTRLMYLSSISEERQLPWRPEDYEDVVVLSMMFDEFEEYRIRNYLLISNQTGNEKVDLSKIQTKYAYMVARRAQKINQFEYFKHLKVSGFIAGKAYRIRCTVPDPVLGSMSKIVTKPLQLCFYDKSVLKSSVDMRRIKGHSFQKGQITLQILCPDQNSQQQLKIMILKNIEMISELYADISKYLSYLNDKD